MWPFKRKPEQRNYTSLMMESRWAAITGKRGMANLTGTVQSCIGLWEAGLSIADVSGTNILTRSTLALMARELGLRGEAVYHIDSGAFATNWDLKTRDGTPTAYRLTMADLHGGRSVTALADEVIHVRIGRNVDAPWSGTAPLQRASLTAGLLARWAVRLCRFPKPAKPSTTSWHAVSEASAAACCCANPSPPRQRAGRHRKPTGDRVTYPRICRAP